MAMWCCTDAVILGQMYEKQDPEKRKGSCMKIIAYFFFLYVVIIVFSCLGYDYYGRSSRHGMPLATISDIFYCLWVISFVGAIGYIRYVIRHKYDIPPQCCTCDEEVVCDDCCCAFWCGCCTTAQVARPRRRPRSCRVDARRPTPSPRRAPRRRPRVRHPRDRHRQLRLHDGDRRAVKRGVGEHSSRAPPHPLAPPSPPLAA